MPIIQSTDSTPDQTPPNPIQIARPAYNGVAVDTRYIPATSLLTHIEGASWTVTYYSQVVDKDNALSGQNLSRDASLQQYKSINQFELKVTTPLSQQQDTQTKAFTLQGQANTYPCGLIPNEGDMFVADVGDGRAGVFEITNSQQNSIYKDATYTVDYKLIDYATVERTLDLESKTVERLVYVSDFLLHGQNPLIAFSEVELLNKLNAYYQEIIDYYFKRHMSTEYRTLVVPGQDTPIYDPFLTHAVLRAFESKSSPAYKYIRELDVARHEAYQLPTIWDALIAKKRARLKGAVTQMGLVTAQVFPLDATMESVRFSGMAYVVYPKNGVPTEDDIRADKLMMLSDKQLKPSPSRLRSLNDLIAVQLLKGLPQTKAYSTNVTDEYYVLSSAFYNNQSTGQSAVELLVQNYLDNKALDLEAMVTLCETYRSWGLLEQFYQIPVLLMMVRTAIRRM